MKCSRLRRRTKISNRLRGFLLSVTRCSVTLPAIRPSPAVSSSANSIPRVNGRVRPHISIATQSDRYFWDAALVDSVAGVKDAENRLAIGKLQAPTQTRAAESAVHAPNA
jgi:hypothetical protein